MSKIRRRKPHQNVETLMSDKNWWTLEQLQEALDAHEPSNDITPVMIRQRIKTLIQSGWIDVQSGFAGNPAKYKLRQ